MPKGIYKHKPLSEKTKRKISESHKGEKHWNWQGGKTKEANKIRNSIEYKNWINNILKRDNYTCQKCGKKGIFLHIHHIKHFADNKKQRLNLDNGITLCVDCHSKLKGHRRLLTKIEREKIRKKLLGRKMSEKTKRKMSKAKMGKKPWNRGIRGIQPWHNISGIKDKKPWNKGIKENRPEVIKKLRKSHLGKTPWNKGIKYKQKKNR